MRLFVRLTADADASYNPEYHHKLRGLIWSALEDTKYDSLHGESVPAYTFSNPYPVSEVIREGEQRKVKIASPYDGLIRELQSEFTPDSEFNIGQLPFTVTDTQVYEAEVGQPGDRGTLRTDTGVFVSIQNDRWDEFGINPDTEGAVAAWVPQHGLGTALTRIRENLSWKHDIIHEGYLQSPSADELLFDDLRRTKTYSVTIPVSNKTGYEYEFIVSKFRLDYTVKDDDHRRWLKLLMDTGIGCRNKYGFGFVNPVE